MFNTLFRKSRVYEIILEEHSTVGRATHDNPLRRMRRFAYYATAYSHKLRICNTYYSSTTMDKRMRLNITLLHKNQAVYDMLYT